MNARPSLLSRAFEPLAASLWILFLVVSALAGSVRIFGIGDGALIGPATPRELAAALRWLLAHLDFAWFTLAAMNTYLGLAAREGLARARSWALAILAAALALAACSALTGQPLGLIRYGARLGPKIGPVPLGLGLWWFVVIIGARMLLLRAFPRFSHARIAALTGLAAALTELNLAPLAAKLRGLWFWSGPQPGSPPLYEAPLTACLAWGVLAGLLAFAFRERHAAPVAEARAVQPGATLLLFHGVFLAAHLGRWLRG